MWVRHHLLPLVLYAFMAVGMTWPLVAHLSDSVIRSGGGDALQHLWHMWWVAYSVGERHQLPFRTDLLYFPLPSIPLYLDSLAVPVGLVAMPLIGLFGLIPAFNLIILVCVMLAGYCTYLLAAYLCGNRAAAIVAGLIFANAPIGAQWVNLGQLDLVPYFVLPLYLLLLLMALRGERRHVSVPAAAFMLVVVSLISWYFGLYCAIVSLAVGLATLIGLRSRWKGVALRGGIIAGGAALPLLPVLLKTFDTPAILPSQPLRALLSNSAALSDFFVSGPRVLWSLDAQRPDTDFHAWLFLGYVTLALALLGLVRAWRRGWLWAVLALVFLEIALGPTLQISVPPDGTSFADSLNNGLPTPNRLLYALPFGNVGRLPITAVIMAMLMLALLAAYGLANLAATGGALRSGDGGAGGGGCRGRVRAAAAPRRANDATPFLSPVRGLARRSFERTGRKRCVGDVCPNPTPSADSRRLSGAAAAV